MLSRFLPGQAQPEQIVAVGLRIGYMSHVSGVAQGVALTADELREMIGGYYEARGWAENGFVPVKKLQELELFKPPAEGVKSCQTTKHDGY